MCRLSEYDFFDRHAVVVFWCCKNAILYAGPHVLHDEKLRDKPHEWRCKDKDNGQTRLEQEQVYVDNAHCAQCDPEEFKIDDRKDAKRLFEAGIYKNTVDARWTFHERQLKKVGVTLNENGFKDLAPLKQGQSGLEQCLIGRKLEPGEGIWVKRV